MGTYNSKDENELNEIRKRKENELKNGKTNDNGKANNVLNNKNNMKKGMKYPCYNTLRDANQVDIKNTIFKDIFPKPNGYINTYENDNEHPIIIENRTNSFSYTTSMSKQMRTSLITEHSHSFTKPSPLLNASDYIDLTSLPIINPSSLNENIIECAPPKDSPSQSLRKSYYSQLILSNIWNPTMKSKHHNTLIFFDWDDTLMCTSYLTPSGLFSEDIKIPEKDKEKIKNLDIIVRDLLIKSTAKGNVYIITNAAPGWVEYSAKRFYPNASKCIKNVNVISARGLFEKVYPGDTRLWKVEAFKEVLKNVNKELMTNLICLGDSIIEIDAVHRLAEVFGHVYIKTVKFKENPTPNELHKQLMLIRDQFDKIYANVKNVAIRVEKKKNENENI